MKLLLCVWLVLSGSMAAPSQQPADLILSQTKVWTASAALPWAEAIAVSGSRIIAVGTVAEILRHRVPKTLVLEYPGPLVVPGFIDNHSHFLEGGFQLLSIDLRPAR
ncbi:MAG TPA: amidohydrolase, partial [Terriglobia bacterium]|nr:amidohydrolase [Terriglobia bacterium]